MKKTSKKSAKRKPSRPAPKAKTARPKPAARKAGPAREPKKSTAGTYTPQPIQGIGWAPFRYPLQ